MNLRTKKFVPMPKHVFDLRAQRQIAQAVNAMLNKRVIAGDSLELHQSDSNEVIVIPQPTFQETFPFQIYSVTNKTATDDQIADFTDAGLNINDFTIQIRSGIVGARTYLNSPESDIDGSIANTIGNFEQDIYVECTDSIPVVSGLSFGNDFYYPQTPNSTGDSVVLDNTADTLLYGLPPGSSDDSDFVLATQIVLNQNVTDENVDDDTWSASFWIEIIDDPTNGLYANLMGRMFSGDTAPSSGRTIIPFPAGAGIVPLGIVRLGYSGANDTGKIGQYFEQMQGGNCINRFPPGVNIQRGYWKAIFAALPAGSTHLAFYPGDQVVDDTVMIPLPGGGSYYRIWQVIAAAPFVSVVGATPTVGNWQIAGMVPN